MERNLKSTARDRNGTDPLTERGFASSQDEQGKEMKIVKSAAIAALLSCSLLTTPAIAGTASPIQDTNGTYADAQALCEAVLKPAAPSGFLTEPVGLNLNTPWENDGAAYPTTSAGPKSGYGTPVPSNIFLTSGFFRNGGSPNIWGGATSRLTYPQTQQLFNMEQKQKRTLVFGCKVYKNPADGPNDPNPDDEYGPDEIMPPGLQTTGNSIVQTQTVPAVPPTQIIISEDDFIVDSASGYALACISPNNTTKAKPGTWVGKHGMTDAMCNQAQANGAFANLPYVPSSNSPDSFIAN
jgi:hypothetical protein